METGEERKVVKLEEGQVIDSFDLWSRLTDAQHSAEEVIAVAHLMCFHPENSSIQPNELGGVLLNLAAKGSEYLQEALDMVASPNRESGSKFREAVEQCRACCARVAAQTGKKPHPGNCPVGDCKWWKYRPGVSEEA